MKLLEIADELVRDLRRLTFAAPVAYVYNPLEYARGLHEQYIRQYGRGRREVLLMGMNPGPWGMAQTGVPFGEVGMVRDWLRLNSPVGRPRREHPKRPVLGLACPRSEVSGRRLWGWARDVFGTADRFFAQFFVANHCPLCFLEAGGRNLTPDKLPATEREPLLAICDRALRRTVEYFRPTIVVGVGSFAETRACAALDGLDVRVGRLLHPSPASPKANRDWAGQAERELVALGIRLPKRCGR